ncbi:MAG: hypothetical protein Q8755_03000 [Candidatus Phytoplasma australasiaticum]|nr:hypothetical protein [Candidatus Phytoplasma australasiaticum]
MIRDAYHNPNRPPYPDATGWAAGKTELLEFFLIGKCLDKSNLVIMTPQDSR